MQISAIAQHIAEITGNKDGQPNCPLPGRIINKTPAKPAKAAIAWLGVTFSPSNKADKTTTKSGDTNPIAAASAKGIQIRPEVKKIALPNAPEARKACILKLRVANTDTDGARHKKGSVIAEKAT